MFSGEGAKKYPGRFNTKGTPVVYTSESYALAMLERMVHVDDYKTLEDQFVIAKATFDESLVRECEVKSHTELASGPDYIVSRQRDNPYEKWQFESSEWSGKTLTVEGTDIITWIPKTLRPGTRKDPTRYIGHEWVQQGISPVLKVPSVVAPPDYNYLLNPEHEDFDQIKQFAPESLTVDSRLVGTILY